MTIRKWAKGQTRNKKTLSRQLNIEQHAPYSKPGVNLGSHEGLPVPVPLETDVVLLLIQFISTLLNIC